jgi:hypothetical protein
MERGGARAGAFPDNQFAAEADGEGRQGGVVAAEFEHMNTHACEIGGGVAVGGQAEGEEIADGEILEAADGDLTGDGDAA